jgi:hypothetical protein
MSNKSSADSAATSIATTDDTASSNPSGEALPSAKRDSGLQLRTAVALTDSLRAYELLAPEIQAFPAERAAVINADVGAMTQSALWAVRQIERHKEQIKREASTYDLGNIEKLRLLALALNYLHARHRYLKSANKTEEAAGLIKQRDELRKGLDFLVSRGFVEQQQLSGMQLTTGHHATAYDIIALVDVLLQVSDRVFHAPYWTRAELEEIRRRADAFFDVLGDKQFGPGAHAELKLARRKVFAMLGALWNDLYDMVKYVRRAERDVDAIMPTLYPPRPGRKGDAAFQEEAPTPSPANAGSDDDADDDNEENNEVDDETAGTLNIAAINAAATRTPSGTTPAEPVPPGFPGSRPLRPTEGE